jgi:hypothetical protein
MTDDNRAWTWGRCYFPAATVETPNFSHGNQSPYAVCSPALGTLVGRKVMMRIGSKLLNVPSNRAL